MLTERAKLVRPHFGVTAGNAQAVAMICAVPATNGCRSALTIWQTGLTATQNGEMTPTVTTQT